MNEKPLERLNYYNGQRLEASDLKTEQEYHIRTRRWLNKSLYSAGIARGLEVRIITEGPKKDTPYVSVSPGLALDNEGREIILLEEETVEVCSFSGTDASTVVGNYLVIEYAEETIAYEKGGCAARVEGKGASKSTAPVGGPSRIQSTVKFSWVPFVPHPGSNQIVLAQVELKDGCKSVGQIDPGERRYIGAASAATVKQYALEGEREVAYLPKDLFPAPEPGEEDTRNFVEVVGRIHFHIRGRQPNAVVLYLRADEISKLHYTELPYHSHDGSASGGTGNASPALTTANTLHKHSVTQKATEFEHAEPDPSVAGHRHQMMAWRDEHGNNHSLRFNMSPSSDDQRNDPEGWLRWVLANANGRIFAGEHTHAIAEFETENWNGFSYDHSHTFSGASLKIANQGVVDSRCVARVGEVLTFVDNLQVFIGPVTVGASISDRTMDIKQQLASVDSANWMDSVGNPKALGDGSGNHVLALSGTGAIRLDFLPGMTFAEGEYCIELRVASKTDSTGKVVANGGKIHYNLYIE